MATIAPQSQQAEDVLVSAAQRQAGMVLLRRIVRNRPLAVGLAVTLVVVLASLLGPWIAPYNPQAMNLGATLLPPSWHHLTGTDSFGRDMFSRLLYGGRVALITGFSSVGIAAILGCALGFVAGYAGGWADMAIQRVVDLMLAFPNLLLAFLVIAVLGPGLVNAIIAIGVSAIPVYARLARAEVLKLKRAEFVEAAQAMGATDVRVLLKHVVPNSLGPILVLAGLGVASAILVEASLSYVGLGAQPPSPDWGATLYQEQSFIQTQWWLPTFPGVAIMITALGFNLVGDGLGALIDRR